MLNKSKKMAINLRVNFYSDGEPPYPIFTAKYSIKGINLNSIVI